LLRCLSIVIHHVNIIACCYTQVFAEPSESLLSSLEKKANESAKYKGKKEKRLQRATFREIHNSFQVESLSNKKTLHFIVFRKEHRLNSILNLLVKH
jgi:hypothetical protein